MDIILSEIEFKKHQETYSKNNPNHPLSDLSKYKIGDGIFIETGTHVGDTVRRAVMCGYKKIYSIEIQTHLYEMVKTHQIFKEYIDSGLIKTYNGSSINELENVLKEVNEPATFWLDGHLHANLSYGVENDSPIIEELNIIKKHKINTHTILIDDMRVIRDSSWGRGFLEDQVINLIKEINSDYKITYCDGIEPNDVLVAKIYG